MGRALYGGNGVGQGHVADLYEIVQRGFSADPARPPAPHTVGDFQRVMGAGGVDVAADVDKLIRLAALQVGQQVNLTGAGNLVFCLVGHGFTSSGHENSAGISVRAFDHIIVFCYRCKLPAN